MIDGDTGSSRPRRVALSVKGKRRLRAAVPETPDRNAEHARLVGEVRGDARAGAHDYADGQDFEHASLRLNGAAVGSHLSLRIWNFVEEKPRNLRIYIRRNSHVGWVCVTFRA